MPPAGNSDEFVDYIVDRLMVFTDAFCENELRDYQKPLARRIFESLVIEDAETLTALACRQSGKTESICNAVAVAMVMLPKLAKMFPEQLGKFAQGVKVGVFAPIELQSDTLFGRILDRLTSEQAEAILSSDDFDDKIEGRGSRIRFKKCRSTADKMTANPRAKIESKTYHLIVIDECQDADPFVITKSILPMRAATAGTCVMTGTPTTHKNVFYNQIQANKRTALERGKGSRPTHFEWDWKDVAKTSPQYKKSIEQEMTRLGEDSPEFQMSYNNKWILDKGMLTTETRLEELGDVSKQQLVKSWTRTPVVVGIDPARSIDSTVVTVVLVDWDRPDELGGYRHFILNWLELNDMGWEEQYFEIVRFLEPYNIWAVGIDAQGVGGAVAERLKLLLRHKNCDVYALKSNRAEQTKRWTHLMNLLNRGKINWPAGAKVRRLRSYKRFVQQMSDAELKYVGPDIVVAAPDEAHAHDDYVDSLALACYMTAELQVATVEVMDNLFFN